jgi:4-hydroxy-3-methylbut-2-en-1-yl diphosphate reductase
MNVILANPRGFCAGVDRAIEIVERALESLGAPIYVKHEVVHNKFVVDGLKARGVKFIEDIDSVPSGNTLIYSAHGVSQAVRKQAEARGLQIFDATCPLVTKVHIEVAKAAKKGEECILIGHKGHPEVEGTMGQYLNQVGAIYLVENPTDVAALNVENPEKLHYVTQTTLSVDETIAIIDALRTRFPAIQGPRKDDICYATQNRQDAVRTLSKQCELVLVVGSVTSSNSNRLKELAEQNGTRSYLIDGAEEIQQSWLESVKNVGVTAGASAPEVLVQGVIEKLKSFGAEVINESKGIEENITFVLPAELR